MIDTETTVQAIFFMKWMSVGQLKKCLEKLDNSCELYPNRVGNLSIVRDDTRVGAIDFNSENLEIYKEDDDV